MMRPLPPFRLRPLRQSSAPKVSKADFPEDVDDGEPVSIKGIRRPIRVVRAAPATRLRVLGRDAHGH
jgi:hypothetical protein